MPSLRELRLRKMLSQRDLARRAEVAPKTVIDLELGRVEPRLLTMRKLAAALGVEPLEVDEFRQAIEKKVAVCAEINGVAPPEESISAVVQEKVFHDAPSQ